MKRAAKTRMIFSLVVGSIFLCASAFAITEEECMKTRGESNQNGQMPWGATNEDIAKYKSGELCKQNEGRPVGKHCQKSVDKLAEVAQRINKMVVDGCKEFVPQVSGISSCLAPKTSSQYSCNADQAATLGKMSAAVKAFRAELENFTKALQKVQNNMKESSTQVVDVLKENEQKRKTPAYNQSGISSSEMGVGTVKMSDELNKFQDSGVAQTLLEEMKAKFSGETYADATRENYNQKAKPITDFSQRVDQLDSEVLREQLHTYVKSEQLKLAAKLNSNELKKLDTTASKMATATTANNSDLSTYTTPAASSAGGLSGLTGAAPPPVDSDMAGAESGLGISESEKMAGAKEYTYGNSPSAINRSLASNNTGVKLDQNNITGGKNSLDLASSAKSEDGDEGVDSKGASRTPASIREALRKKLAAEKAAGGKGGASTAAAVGEGAAGEAGKIDTAGLLGVRGVHGESATYAPNVEGAPEGFQADDLSSGGFEIAGASTDASVKSMLSEFESALGGDQSSNEDIGATDGPSLFSRVRTFHGRCLKRGCVVGTAKGKI